MAKALRILFAWSFGLALPALAQQVSGSGAIGDARLGFGGFAWETSPEAVISRRGPPLVDTLVPSWRILTYLDTIVGQSATARYFFPPQLGLLSGSYEIGFPVGRCADVFKDIRNEIVRKNRGLKLSEKKMGTKFCGDETFENGYWFLDWGDEDSASVSLNAIAGTKEIDLAYSGTGWFQYKRTLAAPSASPAPHRLLAPHRHSPPQHQQPRAHSDFGWG
jgi:hypothetical protein